MYTKKSILDVAPVFLKKERRIEAVLLLYFFALMIVSLIEINIRLNMKKQKIEKLPILPQKMNTKKPTWNNIRYFCRDIHQSVILKNKVTIQVDVQGLEHMPWSQTPAESLSLAMAQWGFLLSAALIASALVLKCRAYPYGPQLYIFRGSIHSLCSCSIRLQTPVTGLARGSCY